jgi:hypothetical protein
METSTEVDRSPSAARGDRRGDRVDESTPAEAFRAATELERDREAIERTLRLIGENVPEISAEIARPARSAACA